MQSDPNFRMPDKFLNGQLSELRWNNIPLPLVNLTSTFETCFGNISRVITVIFAENKRKSEFIVSKFKKVDKNLKEGKERVAKFTEIATKGNKEKFDSLEKYVLHHFKEK